MRTPLKFLAVSFLLFLLSFDSFGQFIANYHTASGFHINSIYVADSGEIDTPFNNSPHPSIKDQITLIYFELNAYTITHEMEKPLDSLIAILNKYPEIRLEVSSHSDSRGTADYNMALTQKRSKSIADYLVSKGVSNDRFILRSFGETQLLNKCEYNVVCTEEMQKENRRTEILFFYPIPYSVAN